MGKGSRLVPLHRVTLTCYQATLLNSGFHFMQESKRSEEDLCGRTDGNMKVIFPKENVAVQAAEFSTAPISPGDYVLVKVGSGSYFYSLLYCFYYLSCDNY